MYHFFGMKKQIEVPVDFLMQLYGLPKNKKISSGKN